MIHKIEIEATIKVDDEEYDIDDLISRSKTVGDLQDNMYCDVLGMSIKLKLTDMTRVSD